MKVRVLPAAKQDLAAGRDFYDRREEGVGSYFLETLLSDLESLEVYAGVHPIHFGRYYRCLSKRFPFAIYYRIEGPEAVVYAVLDCRRDPAWIRRYLVSEGL